MQQGRQRRTSACTHLHDNVLAVQISLQALQLQLRLMQLLLSLLALCHCRGGGLACTEQHGCGALLQLVSLLLPLVQLGLPGVQRLLPCCQPVRVQQQNYQGSTSR